MSSPWSLLLQHVSRKKTLVRQVMGTSAFSAFSNGSFGTASQANGSSPAVSPQHTVTAMGRWSILNKQLPVFKTPLPNPKIWNNPTIGTLSNPDAFVNGGWWHDSRILAATGEGIAKEEPRAWEGWWNEKIVELVQLSTQQKDAFCVLLTGRSESGFSELIKRIVKSKGLEFDMVCLKPAVGPDNQHFTSTLDFKEKFLRALMETYRHAEEIRIYEDRIKHVKSFQTFLASFNEQQNTSPTRGPINGEVIHVADMAAYLDPVVEVAEVRSIIKDHNASLTKRRRGSRGERWVIKRQVFWTGYLISSADTRRLLDLMPIPNLPDSEIKLHANNIMICPRPCPDDLLRKVGGWGKRMSWQVSGTACFEDNVWAVSLQPVPADASYHTGNPVPLVVLALRRGARHADAAKIQHWKPVSPEQAFVFETKVAEKVLLRIDGTSHREGSYDGGYFRGAKRKHTAHEDDFRSRQGNHHHHPPTGPGGGGKNFNSNNNNQNNFPQVSRGGNRGGGGGFGRGGGRGGGGNFRGQRGGTPKGARGGRGGGDRGGHHTHHYKSLDDVGGRDSQGGFAAMYEDTQQPIPKGPSNPSNPGFYHANNQQNNKPNNNGGYQGGGGGGGYQAGGGDVVGNYY
ncbi:hypothetical protein QC764_505950 [Podospora pseudoanserina]|uniref:Swiss Army Knife RNA repair protein HAD domain-containing protein n=1 Tax=Podospora pseudoanserina TaxID=2609844 RepID=A0ABR0I5J4_9PEZI|nr:hypothetical protein QC764_505950 [Podospora pseudoanserina]